MRLRWPLLLLMLGIVATAVAAVEAQRLVRAQKETVAGLVRDYTSIASWNYQRFASENLRDALVAVLAPVMHFQLHGQLHDGPPPTADWFIDHFNDPRSPHYGEAENPIPTHLPETYFGFMSGADTLGVRGKPLAGGIAVALADTLTRHVRGVHQHDWGAGLVTAHGVTVGYTIMPTTLGDTVVYGFVFEPATFAPLFRGVYEVAHLLPSTLTSGRANADLLDVSVAAPDGRIIFESARRAHLSPDGDAPLAPRSGGLRVRAAIRRDAAGLLVVGGLPSSRLPFLLALLGIASALALVAAGQLRREGQLARLRSDFVSNVSHELRTPLAQIRLFLETLRLGRFDSARQREWMLDNVDRETTRLATLVENLLLFNRLGHGRTPGLPEPVDLAEELREIVRAFEPLAAARRARIRTELADGVVACVLRGPFRQVLLNLLDNAVKYGPLGQTITVRLRAIEGDRAQIIVEDGGTGVPHAERAGIWKPFRRGANATAAGAAGGGIGLSIVAEVVERHGGRVRVGDAPGGGAAFVVELPREPGSAARTEPIPGKLAATPPMRARSLS
jgi:signal transduction histidine kinase